MLALSLANDHDRSGDRWLGPNSAIISEDQNMISTENQDRPIIADGTIHGLPVDDVKNSKPPQADISRNDNQFIHPFSEDALREKHRAWSCKVIGASSLQR